MVGGEPKKAKRKKVKEAMGSKKARKKARRNALELLDIASRGCTIRLESLLAKHTDLDVNFAGRDGETALHKAAKRGNAAVITILLRHCPGANTNLRDACGNAPAHLAAGNGFLHVLQVLATARRQLDVDARNIWGDSVRDLVRFAMERSHQNRAAVPPPPASQPPPRPPGPPRPPKDDPMDSEQAWNEKMREAAGMDDPEAAAAQWGTSWHSTQTEGAFSVDEETYARNMREGMAAKAQRTQMPSAATKNSWYNLRGRAAKEEPSRAQAAAAEAQERQRRAEAWAQEARQKASRAQARGPNGPGKARRTVPETSSSSAAASKTAPEAGVAQRRTAYEAAWRALVQTTGMISLATIPWPSALGQPVVAREMLFYGAANAAEQRKRAREELLRWHPDKFLARFGGRLLATDRDCILDRVKGVSQLLNDITPREA